MKKTLSALLVAALLVCSVFALASCGTKLSGTYKNSLGTSFEFSGNKVTVTQNFLITEKSFEGTYEITENDKGNEVIIFTFETEDKDAEDLSGEFSFAKGTEGDTDYIKIAGVKYTKADK